MRIVYYDHSAADRSQRGFRSGEAGSVVLRPNGEFESDARVLVPPNSLHALYAHGVADALNRLAFAFGWIEPDRDAVLRPTSLSDASRILYEADRRTYGRLYEFAVSGDAESGAEYRIVIDNREYQRTLSRLQFLVVSASRSGHSVRLRL